MIPCISSNGARERKTMSKPEQISVEVSLTGNRDVVEKILKTLHNISRLSAIGHSANFAVPVDGGGADRIKIKRVDGVGLPDFKARSRYQQHCEYSD